MKSPSHGQPRKTVPNKTPITLQYPPQRDSNAAAKPTSARSGVKLPTYQPKPKPDVVNGNGHRSSHPVAVSREYKTGSTMVSPVRRRFTLATTGLSDESARATTAPRHPTLVNNYMSQQRPPSQNRSNRGGVTPRFSHQSKSKSAKPEATNGNTDDNGGDTTSENSDNAGSHGNDVATGHPQRPVTPWQMFEDQIKSIDDSSLMCFKKESLNFRSSDAFKATMGDIYAGHIAEETSNRGGGSSPVYGVRFTNLARYALHRRNTEINEKQMALKLAARRGWNKIRRNIQEAQMQRKNSEANMGWRFLQATLRNMTDMERARQDLYKRYLIQPTESEIDRVPPRLLSPQFHKSYAALVKQRQNSNSSGGSPRARSARPERPRMAKRQSMAELFSDAASIE